MVISNHYKVPKINNTKLTGMRTQKSPYKTGAKIAEIVNNNSKPKSVWHIVRDFLTDLASNIDVY